MEAKSRRGAIQSSPQTLPGLYFSSPLLHLLSLAPSGLLLGLSPLSAFRHHTLLHSPPPNILSPVHLGPISFPPSHIPPLWGPDQTKCAGNRKFAIPSLIRYSCPQFPQTIFPSMTSVSSSKVCRFRIVFSSSSSSCDSKAAFFVGFW